jgi:hypothetical protein
MDVSGDCETWQVGLSGTVVSLVSFVLLLTRLVTGRFVRVLGLICRGVHGGAGLAPALA